MFLSKRELYEPAESPLTSRDPSDRKFLDCAYAAEADFIVTSNRRDFPDALDSVTRVVNPGELLDHITLKLLDVAQQRWQRLDGAALLPLVCAGVKFIDGVQKSAKTTRRSRITGDRLNHVGDSQQLTVTQERCGKTALYQKCGSHQ